MAARLQGLQRVAKPWILIPVAVVVAVGVWYGFFRSTSSGSATTPTATESTVTVTRGTLQQTITASGSIEAANTEDLDFSAAGTVTAVNVKAGDTVKAGQALATIDSAQLEAEAQQAQETVDTAQAKLGDDEDDGASSAQTSADEANLASAEAQLTLAQKNLAGATLTSPIAGTVAEVNLTVGQQLGSGGTSGQALSGTATGSGRSASTSAGSATGPDAGGTGGTGGTGSSSSPQIEVISTGSYVVTLDLDTTDIANVKTGQTAMVTPTTSSSSTGFGRLGGGRFAGLPGGFAGSDSNRSTSTGTTTAGQQVNGKVTSVGVIAQASSGVASFPVEVTVSGSSSAFHVGAVANVSIVYNEVANALEVPSLAVDRTGSNPTVTVLTDGKHETRTVTLGIISGSEVQVLSGLDEGDTVVVALPGAARRGGQPSSGSSGGNGDGPTGFGGGFPGGRPGVGG